MKHSFTTCVHQLATRIAPAYHSYDQATTIAWWLMEHLTGLTKTDLYTRTSDILTPEHHTQLELWVHALIVQHMPYQYIIGTVPFGDITLYVQPPILIPRPETEEWCATLVTSLAQPPHAILDLCTGSGCIALFLAHTYPTALVTATDINLQALALAQKNSDYNNIKNIHIQHADLYNGLTGTYNLITANPPYIGFHEAPLLEQSVTAWEDPQALFADDHGYALIKKIIDQAPEYLAEGGQLWLELGKDQGASVCSFFTERGFTHVECLPDLAGHDRVVKGIWHETNILPHTSRKNTTKT